MNVSISSELEQFVRELIGTGRYDSLDEVVQDALKLLQEREAVFSSRREELRKEIAVGLEQAERGQVAPLDMEAIKEAGRKRRSQDQGKR